MEIIISYCEMSGQKLEKISLIFSRNVKEEEKRKLIESLGVIEAENPKTYLGIPSM